MCPTCSRRITNSSFVQVSGAQECEDRPRLTMVSSAVCERTREVVGVVGIRPETVFVDASGSVGWKGAGSLSLVDFTPSVHTRIIFSMI